MPTFGATLFSAFLLTQGYQAWGPQPLGFLVFQRPSDTRQEVRTLDPSTSFASKNCNTEGVRFNSILMYKPRGMTPIAHPSEEDEASFPISL